MLFNVFRKLSRNPIPKLRDEDIQFLQEHTTYKESELREWFREFIMVSSSLVNNPENILEESFILYGNHVLF